MLSTLPKKQSTLPKKQSTLPKKQSTLATIYQILSKKKDVSHL